MSQIFNVDQNKNGKIGFIPLKDPNFGKIPSKDSSLEM